NNAGVGLMGPLESATGPQVQRVFDTNVFGVLRLTQALLPQMKQRRSGHIVVVSSVMGLQGVPNLRPEPRARGVFFVFFGGVPRQVFQTFGQSPELVAQCSLPASRQVFQTFGQSPELVAQAIVSVIGAPRPPFRTPTNPLYSPLLALKFRD
ncbi:retinol dehydrogenase 8-like, partial [Malurus melanocephalus]|uniref:retinol dehydrogenase 8-like n=1 Tax=Malurus melanocephalus TaxID=175006 RepID=UPI0025495E0A